MDRPCRTRKSVDYSQFENDDEDFTFATAPPSKKPRVKDALPKKEKKEKSSQKPQKAVTERVPLDEKLYQRDLEVALALSVKDTSIEVHSSPSNETCTNAETNDVGHTLLLSNCSVDSGVLELDRITDDKDNELAIRCPRVAASKALTEQRKMLVDDSDNEEKCEEYKPDLASDAESESDSNFSDEEDIEFESALKKCKKSKDIKKKGIKLKVSEKETKSGKSRLPTTDADSESDSNFSDEEDIEFKSSLKKCKKSKDIKKKGTKLKVSSEKETKSGKSRLPSPAAATCSSTSTIKIKSLPMSKTSVSPKPVGSPKQANSPPVVGQRPSWTPPSASGRSNNALGGISVKSPNQGLRLGLSRFARVKPLHPSVASS